MEKSRYRMKMSERTVASVWRGYESTCTTGQFASLGNGFKRHCGPTAAANLVLTINKRFVTDRESDQNDTFLTCARLGMRTFLYENMDFLGRFGGTSDLLVPLYLSLCFRKCACPARVAAWKPLTERTVREALRRGSLLYVEVRHHPKYQNHHFICYGAREMRDAEGRELALFLMCADGWKEGLTPIALSSIKRGTFYEIQSRI